MPGPVRPVRPVNAAERIVERLGEQVDRVGRQPVRDGGRAEAGPRRRVTPLPVTMISRQPSRSAWDRSLNSISVAGRQRRRAGRRRRCTRAASSRGPAAPGGKRQAGGDRARGRAAAPVDGQGQRAGEDRTGGDPLGLGLVVGDRAVAVGVDPELLLEGRDLGLVDDDVEDHAVGLDPDPGVVVDREVAERVGEGERRRGAGRARARRGPRRPRDATDGGVGSGRVAVARVIGGMLPLLRGRAAPRRPDGCPVARFSSGTLAAVSERHEADRPRLVHHHRGTGRRRQDARRGSPPARARGARVRRPASPASPAGRRSVSGSVGSSSTTRPTTSPLDPRADALLFSAARAQLVAEVIRPGPRPRRARARCPARRLDARLPGLRWRAARARRCASSRRSRRAVSGRT